MDYATAITIFVPHEVQAIAIPLLKQYAPDNLGRVPAHITLLYPFVVMDRLPQASRKVRTIAADVAPFDVTLDGYGAFPGVLFMEPTNSVPIQALFRKVTAAFPECNPYDGAFGNNLTPHVTVGVFQNEGEQNMAVLPAYKPITFRVERLHVVYGPPRLALPWITYDVIPLGG